MYTLVTTTGSLTGTFSGLPDGAAVAMQCSTATPPMIQINYTAHAVTATVAANTAPPPVLGKSVNVQPVSGQVLIKLPSGARSAAASTPPVKGTGFVSC